MVFTLSTIGSNMNTKERLIEQKADNWLDHIINAKNAEIRAWREKMVAEQNSYIEATLRVWLGETREAQNSYIARLNSL